MVRFDTGTIEIHIPSDFQLMNACISSDKEIQAKTKQQNGFVMWLVFRQFSVALNGVMFIFART